MYWSDRSSSLYLACAAHRGPRERKAEGDAWRSEAGVRTKRPKHQRRDERLKLPNMSAVPSPPSVASTTDVEETDDSASVTDSVASSVETFTCHTAPGVVFTSRTELSDHYRSDWHRYNLKRKVAQLPPVAREEFERRRAEALAHADNSKPKQQQHLKKNKKRGGGGSKAGNPRASGQSATAGGAPRAAGVAAAAADTTAQDAGDGGAEESKGETDEPTTQASRNDAGVTLRTIFQGMAAGLTAEELAEGGHDFDWDALE